MQVSETTGMETQPVPTGPVHMAMFGETRASYKCVHIAWVFINERREYAYNASLRLLSGYGPNNWSSCDDGQGS